MEELRCVLIIISTAPDRRTDKRYVSMPHRAVKSALLTCTALISIGVGDGEQGARASPPPKWEKIGNYYVKFRHFSGKNHVKFGHFVNFSYIFFGQKMPCASKVD